MSIASVRSAVAALLAGVTGIGKVHETAPFGQSLEDFYNAFLEESTGKVNGWWLETVEDRPVGQGIGYFTRDYTVTVTGFLGMESAEGSRAEAEALVDRLVLTFAGTAANRRLPLSGTGTVDWTDPPTFTLAEYNLKAGTREVTAHRIQMVLRAHKDEALA